MLACVPAPAWSLSDAEFADQVAGVSAQINSFRGEAGHIRVPQPPALPQANQSFDDAGKALRTLMAEPSIRRQTVNAMTEFMRRRSDRLSRQHRLSYDVVIVGGGIHAAVYALNLRRSRPDLKVLILEQADEPMAQFRSYGRALILNSPTLVSNFANANHVPGLPVQLTDFNDLRGGDHVPAESIADLAVVSIYLSGADLRLGAHVTDVRRASRGLYVASGDGFSAYAKRLIVATGSGSTDLSKFEPSTRRLIEEERARVLASGRESLGIELYEDYLLHYRAAELSPRKYAGKTIAVLGAGDAGNTAVEGLLDANVLGHSHGQNPGRLRATKVVWLGQPAENDIDFFWNNKGRYSYVDGLMAFFPGKIHGPHPAKREGLELVATKGVRISRRSDGDYDNIPEGLAPVNGSFTLEGGHFDDAAGIFVPTPLVQEDRRLALEVVGENVALVGPAANAALLVHSSEGNDGIQSSYDDRTMKSLTHSRNSLELTLPRTKSLAERDARGAPKSRLRPRAVSHPRRKILVE